MKITISEEQKEKLEEQHKTERDSRVCDRIKAVLLANEGWTQKQITQALRIHETSQMPDILRAGVFWTFESVAKRQTTLEYGRTLVFLNVQFVPVDSIEALVNKGILQLELFETSLCEVKDNGVRYVLRRNPVRAEEMAESRLSKTRSVVGFVEKQNGYLRDHPNASASKMVGDAPYV